MNSKQWQDDIDCIRTELPERHKNLFFKTDRSVFEKRLNELSENLADKTDLETVLAIQEIIAEMGDDHTEIDYFSLLGKERRFPCMFYWFSDGIYPLRTIRKHEAVLGSRLAGINEIPIQEVVQKLSKLFPGTNDAIVKFKAPNLLICPALLRYFGIGNSESTRYSFVNAEEERFSATTSDADLDTNEEDNQPARLPAPSALCWHDEMTPFWSKMLDDEGLLYAQYNRCTGKEILEARGNKKRAAKTPSFSEFASDLLERNRSGNVHKFVFDMRFNPGGYSPQGTEFIEDLATIKDINKKGRLFVVIGRRTYSSAVVNAIDFKKHTEAILVGEPTSGQPNHYGEVRKLTLPNSGLNVTYSTEYFQHGDDDADSLYPDILAETTYDDFTSGRDPAMQAILEYPN